MDYLPFRRRPSRVEQLRRSLDRQSRSATAAVRRTVADRDLSLELPPFGRITEISRRVLPGHEPEPEPTAQSRMPYVPAWALSLGVVGGLAIGLGIGMWMTERRSAARIRAKQLQSAADEIKAEWPDVTDDDIQKARGSAGRLSKTIGRQTGEDTESVRERLAAFFARDGEES